MLFYKKHYLSPATRDFSIKFTLSFSVYWMSVIFLGARCTEMNKAWSLTARGSPPKGIRHKDTDNYRRV